MKRETYNSRLKSNPEDIPVGSLLRVKKHCRKNNIIKENGELALRQIVTGKQKKYFQFQFEVNHIHY